MTTVTDGGFLPFWHSFEVADCYNLYYSQGQLLRRSWPLRVPDIYGLKQLWVQTTHTSHLNPQMLAIPPSRHLWAQMTHTGHLNPQMLVLLALMAARCGLVPVRSRLMIFGENLLALLVLAIGAALAFGNLMALIRPRSEEDIGEGELARPPLGRSLIMIAVGLTAAVWALASLATADSPADSTSSALSVTSAQHHDLPAS